ncbi:MAG: OmpA family protein [Magnetococcales bacterium]|nr:OmpA family protein [Magnetococcales bacterium]
MAFMLFNGAVGLLSWLLLLLFGLSLLLFMLLPGGRAPIPVAGDAPALPSRPPSQPGAGGAAAAPRAGSEMVGAASRAVAGASPLTPNAATTGGGVTIVSPSNATAPRSEPAKATGEGKTSTPNPPATGEATIASPPSRSARDAEGSAAGGAVASVPSPPTIGAAASTPVASPAIVPTPGGAVPPGVESGGAFASATTPAPREPFRVLTANAAAPMTAPATAGDPAAPDPVGSTTNPGPVIADPAIQTLFPESLEHGLLGLSYCPGRVGTAAAVTPGVFSAPGRPMPVGADASGGMSRAFDPGDRQASERDVVALRQALARVSRCLREQLRIAGVGVDGDDGIGGEVPFLSRTPAPSGAAGAIDGVADFQATIRFALGTAEVDAAGHALLASLLRHLHHLPRARVQVWGHSDRQGPEALNLALSRERAQRVAAIITAGGIAPERLEVAGYGASLPADDGDSEMALAHNRRVDVRIHEGP